MKGKMIETVERVIELALQKKCCVWYDRCRQPAAFLANMQAWYLYREIQKGNLHEYVKEGETSGADT